MQELSEIKQEKYSVQEGALAEKYGGVTLGDYVVGCRVYDYQNLGETTIELTELQEFSEMLQSTFHELAQANDVETEDYILQMLENGEYDHQAYHPGEDFRSGLLDTVTFGVKPMLEMIAGEDFVTGEEMTDTLRKEKSIEVIMGMVAVAGIPLTKIGSQGAKGFVTQLGIEMATGAVGYTIYEAGEAIDLPPGLTMVATLAGGALTYRFLEGRILRVGVAEGVSASALDSLDDGLKSVDDIVERPIKGGTPTSLRDLMTPEEIARYDAYWDNVADDMLKSNINNYRQAILNGDITKPTGGKINSKVVTAAIDTNTGDIYYGISGMNNNPTRNAINPQMQAILDSVDGTMTNYPLENCGEFNAINNALNNGVDINSLRVYSVDRVGGNYKAPCINCQNLYGNIVHFTE